MNKGYFIMKSVNRLLQKVQETVIFSPFFAQKLFDGQFRIHAYHSTPSNKTKAGHTLDRRCMPHNTKSRLHCTSLLSQNCKRAFPVDEACILCQLLETSSKMNKKKQTNKHPHPTLCEE